ncbi:fasciclin domain-containing protein [Nocardioides humilatus]|uniref:Fasciclin domain-containing protein n=1 Tax=Nocardioides humilatus TaxID=2607660 RepID=A0A5B1LKH1_9ACTN|nr:fasciclin domain-containing protein [Nocardioides humilatus]KAA1420250.1 fasciclin domain-containing protein [Nocardioides humilatus]
MKRNHFVRNTALAAGALALSVSLAACGDDGDDKDSSSKGDSSSDAGAQTFGKGCAAVPTDGAGSFDGMVKDPVATAASNNPLLTTLVTAVGAIDGLGDTLNGAEALTVFAPYNDAFAEIPADDLNALVMGGQKDGQESTLYKILAHHVLGANEDEDAVGGKHDTLAGDSLTIEGNPEDGMTVSDGTVTANVLCGNIPTANATVYVIDKVLTGVK